MNRQVFYHLYLSVQLIMKSYKYTYTEKNIFLHYIFLNTSKVKKCLACGRVTSHDNLYTYLCMHVYIDISPSNLYNF